MSEQSTILNLPYIQPSQAQKHVTHNEALRALDLLVQTAVSSRDIAAAPVTPAIGDRYIVAASATGAWAGQDTNLALWDGVSWSFVQPSEGWRAWVTGTQELVVFSGGAWVPVVPDFQNIGGVGVQTSYDATNRLAVSSDATLLTHAGTGHQLKINKNAVTDTASLLFQTGYSGRAEMGLAGDDSFSVKTSADGSTWAQAIVVDGSGRVGIGQAPVVEALEVSGNVLADAHLTPSDARLKTNIHPAPEAGDLIDKLSVVSFDWLSGGSVSHGLIAQQVAQVLPELVSRPTTPDHPWSVDMGQLVPLLLAEIQQLRARLSAAGL